MADTGKVRIFLVVGVIPMTLGLVFLLMILSPGLIHYCSLVKAK